MFNHIKYYFLDKQIRKRWSFQDFLHYRMQNMSKDEISNYMTEEELWDFEKQVNNDQYRKFFNSKKNFYIRFKKYINREIIFLSDVTSEDFSKFLNKYPLVVLKPDDKYAGIGFKLLHKDNYNDFLLNEFQYYKDQNYIAEEYLYQGKEYRDIYDKSLNTVRITSYINNQNQVDILFAVQQFGSKGSLVDNDDDSSLWYVINLESGQIEYVDIDEKTGFIYEQHPDSHIEMKGFQIPHFKEMIDLVKKLAIEIPECRLIGWDIAFLENNKLEIIEGNVTPELMLYQYISGKGLGFIRSGK